VRDWTTWPATRRQGAKPIIYDRLGFQVTGGIGDIVAPLPVAESRVSAAEQNGQQIAGLMLENRPGAGGQAIHLYTNKADNIRDDIEAVIVEILAQGETLYVNEEEVTSVQHWRDNVISMGHKEIASINFD